LLGMTSGVWETRRGLARARRVRELVRELARVLARVLARALARVPAPVLSVREHRSWALGSAPID
jgi:hypothetical protein